MLRRIERRATMWRMMMFTICRRCLGWTMWRCWRDLRCMCTPMGIRRPITRRRGSWPENIRAKDTFFRILKIVLSWRMIQIRHTCSLFRSLAIRCEERYVESRDFLFKCGYFWCVWIEYWTMDTVFYGMKPKENFLIISCAFLDCLVQRTNFFLSLLNDFLMYMLIFLVKRNHLAASDVEFVTALMVKDFKILVFFILGRLFLSTTVLLPAKLASLVVLFGSFFWKYQFTLKKRIRWLPLTMP